MNEEIQTSRAGMRMVALYVGLPGLLLVGLLVYLLFGGSSGDEKTTTRKKGGRQENHLATVRTTLAKQDDLAACKSLIPQLNAHLQVASDHAPPKLPDKDREWLRQHLDLREGDLGEVASPTFTPLDAHHIASCFLLRDAARFLDLAPPGEGSGKIKQEPLDRALNRARLAFAWVMRQVRLQPRRRATSAKEPWGEPVPPSFVLRRGWGTALERALVFLAVLEQFAPEEESARLQGALVFTTGAKGEKSLWCCGVAIGKQPGGLHLFDPRLGLPLPGPGGKGIATLAEARKDKEVLAQLRVETPQDVELPTSWLMEAVMPALSQWEASELRYDVTAEQAKEAEVYLFCSLSALAPRMALLQDHLLRELAWKSRDPAHSDEEITHPLPQSAAPVRVRLAENAPAALAVLQTAVEKSGGKGTQVKVWREGAAILRRFLPVAEGGSDVDHPFFLRQLRGFTSDTDPLVVGMTRQHLCQLEAAPWQDFPPQFNTSEVFGPSTSVGQHVRNSFGVPFVKPILEPGSTRDMILRGRLAKAAPELVREQEYWQQMRRRRLEAVDLMAGLKAWADRAVAAYAQLHRAKGTLAEGVAREQVNDLWKPGEAIDVVLHGAAAEGAGAEATYQLGLCKHELAARLQARKELAAQAEAVSAEDARTLNNAWKDAEGYWKEYVETYRDRPWVASALYLRAEAQTNSDETKEAIRTWQTPAPMTNLERLARLWLAKRLAGSP